MTSLTLVGTEPEEGFVNDRNIGIYVSDEYDGFILTMFKHNPLDPSEQPEEVAQWKIPDMADPLLIARQLLLGKEIEG